MSELGTAFTVCTWSGCQENKNHHENISAGVTASCEKCVLLLRLFFFFFLQELIENKFVGFVVTGVAMTTATAPRKKK